MAATASAPSRLRLPFGAGALLALSALLTLFGYECARSSANTLFKMEYGVGALPWIMAAVPVAVAAMLVGYGALLTRLGPRRTLGATMALSAAALTCCWWGVRAGWRPASAVLYLLKEGYVVLLVEQFWSFLNSTMDVKSAKRWNGPIIGVSSIGATLGGEFVHQAAVPWGTPQMVLVAAVTLLPAALLSELAYRRVGEPRAEASPHRGPLRLRLFREEPILGTLFTVVVLTQFVSSATGLAFEGALQRAIPDRDAQAAYSGRFYSTLNLSSALLQFLVAPWALTSVPLGVFHYGLPLFNGLAAVWLMTKPGLGAASGAFMVFKALDYSFFRAIKEVLYIPLSFDVRYRAKEVIDAFGYRFGKGVSSLGLGLLQGASVWGAASFGVASAAAALAWGLGVSRILRHSRTD